MDTSSESSRGLDAHQLGLLAPEDLEKPAAQPQPMTAPGQVDPLELDPLPELQPDEQSSFRRFLRGQRRTLFVLLGIGLIIAFILVVLPQLAGFGGTLHRLRHGNKSWLALCLAFESASLLGYIALLRTVFSCHAAMIGWRASYQITMAGTVATKLFAAAGAGGVALTAWALRASGLEPRTVARRMASFEILLYSVYMLSLVLFGIGLAVGVLPGSAPLVLTIVPAGFGALVILLVGGFRFLPPGLESRLASAQGLPPRLQRLLVRAAAIPRTLQEGVRTAAEILRSPRLGLLGAFAYWGFDIGTLWAAFHAFGASPAFSVVVMAYFLGMLANALPLPAGIGGVEGGMIGAFIAFGVNGSTTILAVLAYRAVSFWLPTLPGILAYFQLRRTVATWRASHQDARPDGAARSPAAVKPHTPLR